MYLCVCERERERERERDGEMKRDSVCVCVIVSNRERENAYGCCALKKVRVSEEECRKKTKKQFSCALVCVRNGFKSFFLSNIF